MYWKRSGVAVLRTLIVLLMTGYAAAQAGCPSGTFEGVVESGKSFRHAVGASQEFLLESIPSGWAIRILAAHGPRSTHNFAELATPPYRSPNPLLVTTDFSFRAQDAVAWNPREFHFFTKAGEMSVAEGAYAATLREPNRPAAGGALFPLLEHACRAELRILDARIAGGSADQSLAAATVASHFAQTAHTVDTAASPTKLGKILMLRFRVRLGVERPKTAHRR